jgi:hypothetical protein
VKSDEFIREVDEELRRDRMAALWRRYAPWIIGAALAVVVGTAAGVGWRAWQDHAREDNARRFAAAERLLRGGEAAEAAAAFAELADDAGGGYAVLARLRAAEALSRAGDQGAAAAMLEGLADDGSVGSPYRELGGVLAALRGLDDGADPERLAERVGAYAAGEEDPWRYTAREIYALGRLQAGDTEAARGALTELVNEPGTPASLRRRAFEVLASLGGPPPGAARPGEGAERPPREEASQ